MKYISTKDKKFVYVGYAVAITILIVMGLLFFYWYNAKLIGYKPGEATYQLYGDMSFGYSRNAEFHEGNDVIVISDEGEKFNAVGTPLLHSGSKDITILSDMLINNPTSDDPMCRLRTFTEVSYYNGRTGFERNNKSAMTIGGFLYDAEDTFIFLEDVTLKIGTARIPLGPMSYAIATYNDEVEYYNSNTGEVVVQSIYGTDVYAETDEYEVNLTQDTARVGNFEYLLFSSMKDIDVIEMQ